MWKNVFAILLCGGAVLTAALANAAPRQEHASARVNPGMIVLTDDIRPSGHLPQSLRDGHEEARRSVEAQMQVQRDALLARLGQIVAQTERQGYAVVANEQIPAVRTFTQGMRSGIRLGELDLAYPAADVRGGAFASGILSGLRAQAGDDSRVHQLVYWFEFAGLGTVIVDELSFATVPGVRISVNKPAGNLHVNGIPATYTVLRNPDGDKGLTTIAFVTDAKMFTLTVFDSIAREDRRFQRLLTLASALS